MTYLCRLAFLLVATRRDHHVAAGLHAAACLPVPDPDGVWVDETLERILEGL